MRQAATKAALRRMRDKNPEADFAQTPFKQEKEDGTVPRGGDAAGELPFGRFCPSADRPRIRRGSAAKRNSVKPIL